MKQNKKTVTIEFDGILFKTLVKFAGAIKDETLQLGISSPNYPVKPVFSDALEQLRAIIAQAEQLARNQASGCVDCGKLRCENCERLWQS